MYLYKKDSSNKILQWTATPYGDSEGLHISIKYGELNGKQVEKFERNIQGKNIGKLNATTPAQQRDARIQSLYNRKRKQGYKSLEDLGWTLDMELNNVDWVLYLQNNLKFHTTDENENPKPMLCQQYFKASKKEFVHNGKTYKDKKYYYLQNPYAQKTPKEINIKFPALIQPKINGIRAMVKLDENGEVIMLGKSGIFYNVEHIKQIFRDNIEVFDSLNLEVIFDGELYIPGESINIINSAVQATNLNTSRIEYHIFDLAIPDVSQRTRLTYIKQLFEEIKQPIIPSLIRVVSKVVHTDLQIQEITDSYIKQGYEGSVIRRENNDYKFGKRPVTMVKLKRTISDEFPIIDIIPQEKEPDFGLFVCRNKKGVEFNVTPTDNATFKQMILALKHKYIGKQLTCVFYEYTDKDIPFHIIDCSIRDYE